MNHRTDSQACPRRGVGQGMGGTGPLLSLWRTVIASSIPFLSVPDISFPPIYLGAGRGWRRGKGKTGTPALDLAAPFQSCFSSAFFFFFYQTEVLPPTVYLYPGDHQQACSFQMPQPPCRFQGHFAFSFPLMTLLFQ